MKYKRLGRTGLLVSELSFGTWITFNKSGQISKAEQAYEVMKTAFKAGVNFFDCAELYANGEAEEITGEAYQMGVKENLWKRTDLVISTKLFFGAIPEECKPGYNEHMIKVNRVGCSRKHIIEGMKESLERMNLDYVDLVFSHRPDPLVDIEEVVRGFNYLIEQGYAFYWGTSEWSAQMIQEAITVSERLGLIGPVIEQPEYNLVRREQVEIEYRRLYPKLGLTIWSPLYYGILTGKYNEGIPEGSRLATEMFKDTNQSEKFKRAIEGTKKLEPIAKELGCTLAQLALAWCMSNPNISTTIGGASNIKQVEENLKAVEFVDKLTPEVLKQIDDIFQPPSISSGDKMGITIRKKAGQYRHVDI